MAETKHVYHGTDNDFNEFSLDFIGTKSGTTGAGFGIYFTELEAEAFTYGNNIFKCLLILKGNISNVEHTLSLHNFKTIVIDTQDFLENYGIQSKPENTPDYIIENIFNDIRKYTTCDTEFIGSLINGGLKTKDVFASLIKMGFDHTIDNKESYLADEQGVSHYICYDLNSIQILKKYNLESR